MTPDEYALQPDPQLSAEPPKRIRVRTNDAGWRRPTLSKAERELLRMLVRQHASVAGANIEDMLLSDQQREVYRSRHAMCVRLLGKLADE